jgi:hypothetical protein
VGGCECCAIELLTGKVTAALATAEQSVAYAKRCGDAAKGAGPAHFMALHAAGRLVEAAGFAQAFDLTPIPNCFAARLRAKELRTIAANLISQIPSDHAEGLLVVGYLREFLEGRHGAPHAGASGNILPIRRPD